MRGGKGGEGRQRVREEAKDLYALRVSLAREDCEVAANVPWGFLLLQPDGRECT